MENAASGGGPRNNNNNSDGKASASTSLSSRDLMDDSVLLRGIAADPATLPRTPQIGSSLRAREHGKALHLSAMLSPQQRLQDAFRPSTSPLARPSTSGAAGAGAGAGAGATTISMRSSRGGRHSDNAHHQVSNRSPGNNGRVGGHALPLPASLDRQRQRARLGGVGRHGKLPSSSFASLPQGSKSESQRAVHSAMGHRDGRPATAGTPTRNHRPQLTPSKHLPVISTHMVSTTRARPQTRSGFGGDHEMGSVLSRSSYGS